MNSKKHDLRIKYVYLGESSMYMIYINTANIILNSFSFKESNIFVNILRISIILCQWLKPN